MKSFSFRLPRLGSSPLISQWLLATLVLSIVAHFDGGFLASRFALIPSRVWLGEIWRLVTWPMIELGPVSLLATLVVIFRLGSDLATRWGDRRLQRYVLQIVVGAAVATVLLSTVFGLGRMARIGGWALDDLLVIGWARQFPTQQLSLFYGMLKLSGRQLILFTIGASVLFAIYLGPITVAPELAACALAYWYPARWLQKS